MNVKVPSNTIHSMYVSIYVCMYLILYDSDSMLNSLTVINGEQTFL